jgi:hypothetical protein
VRNIAGVVFQMCVQLCAQIALEAVKNHVWTPVAAATANGKIDKNGQQNVMRTHVSERGSSKADGNSSAQIMIRSIT